MTTMGELRTKRNVKEQEITEIAHKIEDRLDFYKDWQQRVKDSPLKSFGYVLGAGFLLGSGLSSGLLQDLIRPVVRVAQLATLGYLLNWLRSAR
jgi:hypothetical protein